MYGGVEVGVRASLVTGRGRVIGGRRADRLVAVENLYGSLADDVLIGDGGPNTLFGDRGDDTLRGGDGGDKLLGGPGDDTLDGGPPDGGETWPVGDSLDGEAGFDICFGGESPPLGCEG